MKKLLILFIILITVSCSFTGRNTMKKDVATTAQKIHLKIVSVKESIIKLTANIEEVYNNPGKYDLSIDTLDKKDGGVFDSYNNYTYYYKTVNTGASYYFTPMKPVTDDMKKEIKKATHIENFMQETHDSSIIRMVNVDFCVPYTIGLLYPWFDMISAFPPGLDFQKFEWFSRGFNSPHDPIWSEKPFADLYAGWVIDISMPIQVNNTSIGASVISMEISKLIRHGFTGVTSPLMIIGSDLSLLGATDKVKDYFDIKVIEDDDYLGLIKENKFVPEKYKITSETQTDSIRKIGSEINAGKNDFTIVSKGKKLIFNVKKIDEINYFVAGFSE